jgi:hypothetical protein
MGRSLTSERAVLRLARLRRLTLVAMSGLVFSATFAAGQGVGGVVRDSAPWHCAARKNCARVLGLWAQARAGLLAVAAAREDRPARLRWLRFDREMDGTSDRIVSALVRVDTVDTRVNPFLPMHPPQDVGRFGFADDPWNSATFYAPDVDVLLSEGFARAYGIELAAADRKRPNQVGLHFVADDRRPRRVDVDGTLWVDTAAHELRGMEFRYVGMPPYRQAFRSGGEFEFRTMPNGVTLVDRWSVRLVRAVEDTVLVLGDHRDSGFESTRGVRLYAEERGGEIADATWRDGSSWKAPLGHVRIHAITANRGPAAGSILALVGTPFFGVVDATGMAEFTGVLRGRYAVRVIDPRISVVQIGVPTALHVMAIRDSTTGATLQVPTAEAFIAERCVAAHQWTAGDSVFVFGRLVAPDGTPISHAKVTFADGTHQWRAGYVVTGTDGLFQSCEHWRIGDEVLIRVHRSGAGDAELTRTFSSTILAIRFIVGTLR